MTADETAAQQRKCADHLVESNERSETACNSSTRRPIDSIAADPGRFGQHRRIYDGNGDYEFAKARHYVPRGLCGNR